MNDEDMRFASMSGRGVHDKVLEIAEPYLANAQILIAGAGEGALEHKLLRNGAPAEKIQAVIVTRVSTNLSPLTFNL